MIRLTRAQVREIDRLATEKYHVPSIVLMENAARALVKAAREMMRGDCIGEILILCGGGNNGGDGLAAARHLANCGADVAIALCTDPAKYRGDALTNWQIVQAMGIEAFPVVPERIDGAPAVLIIDAIYGTGLQEAPRDPFADIAQAVRRHGAPVLAVDVPSGLDCDTGQTPGACIVASRTVTFVAEKVGFAQFNAKKFLGEITVGDIGCPAQLLAEVLHSPA